MSMEVEDALKLVIGLAESNVIDHDMALDNPALGEARKTQLDAISLLRTLIEEDTTANDDEPQTHPDLSEDDQIETYFHCGLCIKELLDAKKRGEMMDQSPQTYSRYSLGWTQRGLQAWCNRHNANVANIDFEGAKHPAITTRKEP